MLRRNDVSYWMLVLFRYYAFHDVFVREVLGKKLSKGTKKDLDDISAKTAVTLKSCRRQVNLTPQPPSTFVVRGSQLLLIDYKYDVK